MPKKPTNRTPPSPSGSPAPAGRTPRQPAERATDRAADFEQALSRAALNKDQERYALRLFVTGNTPRSSRAVQNIQTLCEKYLKGRYELEVVDIIQQPELASSVGLIAAPTLLKRKPEPPRRVIGDLSDTDKVLLGLDIQPVPPNPEAAGRTGHP